VRQGIGTAGAATVLVDVTGRDPMPDRLVDVILAHVLVGGMFAFVYENVYVAVLIARFASSTLRRSAGHPDGA
jgi:hypothetical protein